MDIITTSLEALIQRATNVHNQGPDTAAIDAFCGLINKEPECTQAASKFIIAKAHSLKEWEALQALLLLENCMKKCGVWFHSEVGKYRFLNELIKLVSPKYLGAHTPESVKRRVLELMSSWSTAFPNQAKIKEAYIMLKKQGVVPDALQTPEPAPTPVAPAVEPKERASIFQDEEKSMLLQKLLRSSNPVDLQAANRLIKTMVKEDERRVEEKWRRRVELETVVNNCLLLREMLTSYENGTSSPQDIELINELHTTCTNLRPVLIRLANNPDPSFTCDVLSANDELGEVLAKYKEVMSSGVRPPPSQQSALLDLTSPERPTAPSSTNPMVGGGAVNLIEESGISVASDNQISGHSVDDILSLVPNSTVPISQNIPQSSQTVNKTVESTVPPKPKGLEELDLLGENMLKEILSNSGHQQSSKRNSAKVSMNELLLNGSSQKGDKSSSSCTTNQSEPTDLLDRLSPSVSSDSGYAASSTNSILQGTVTTSQNDLALKSDEPLLSLGDIDLALESLGLSDFPNDQTEQVVSEGVNADSLQSNKDTTNITTENPRTEKLLESQVDSPNFLGSPAVSIQSQDSPQTPASLSDIALSIDSIKPSGLQPWEVVCDTDGVTVLVTLASDKPRPDVSVFVITTTNKSKQPICDFELRAIVPKRCKVRLLTPNTKTLPPFNPFLPPAAIIQIMLIASYSKDPINLKLVLNYTMDEETVTDIGQVDQLRLME